MESERILATVLFTDIVGSTERAAELGDRRWRELLAAHDALVRRELARYGGRELTTTGDGFLASFDAPERAIRCASAIRDGVRELGMEIRAGLHAGEVDVVSASVGGIAVHIGARVAAQAGAGEVLVSSTVHDLVAGSGFEFADHGTHALKGVPGDWRLYAVTDEPFRIPVARSPAPGVGAGSREPGAGRGSRGIDLAGIGRSLRRGRLPGLTRGRSVLAGVVAFSLLFGLAGLYVLARDRGRSFTPAEAVAEAAAPGIAVLPFDVRGAGLDVWREGIVDVLSTNLDGAGGLRAIDSRTVLARWSEQVPAGRKPDLQTALGVARSTGARYAVVGSATATGPDVRFAAEVYDVESGARVGQGGVVSPLDSVLPLADRLSIEVLRAVGGEQGDLPQGNLQRVTTASLAAMKAFLEGEVHFRKSRFQQAVPAYERAVEADSTFALAWMRLAQAYGWAENIESDLADRAAERAVRLADRLPPREAVLARGDLALNLGTLEGIEPLREAVRRYPDDPAAWFLLGDTYYHIGAQALVTSAEAERAIAKAVELDPGFAPYYAHLIEAAIRHGRRDEAARLIETNRRLAPGTTIDVANGLAYALLFGDSASRGQAQAVLDTLQGRVYNSLALGSSFFWNARLLGTVEALLVVRPDISARGPYWLAHVLIARGRPAVAWAHLEDERMAPYREELLYTAHAHGLPVPREQLERLLSPTPPDSAGFGVFYKGAYAAEQGRWHEQAAALVALWDEARPTTSTVDTTEARFAEGAAKALDGFGKWRKGEPEAALQTLQAAQRQATGVSTHARLNGVIRWWLGELLLEMERPREAERYFRALAEDTDLPVILAWQRLGRIYETVGEDEKAREAYETFAAGWQDAQLELQPMVEDARTRAERLARGRGAPALAARR